MERSLYLWRFKVDYQADSEAKVFRVQEIWEASNGSSSNTIIKVQQFDQLAQLHPYYGMKEIRGTGRMSWISPEVWFPVFPQTLQCPLTHPFFREEESHLCSQCAT